MSGVDGKSLAPLDTENFFYAITWICLIKMLGTSNKNRSEMVKNADLVGG